ncbi:MAG: hypothetical protein IH827_07050, partial [Myxococcales bacterium]|nr:hypothetical protein [Myxococcales bacterium]
MAIPIETPAVNDQLISKNKAASLLGVCRKTIERAIAEGAIVPEGETIGWLGARGEQPPPIDCRLAGWEPEVAPPPPELARRLAMIAPPGDAASRDAYSGADPVPTGDAAPTAEAAS